VQPNKRKSSTSAVLTKPQLHTPTQRLFNNQRINTISMHTTVTHNNGNKSTTIAKNPAVPRTQHQKPHEVPKETGNSFHSAITSTQLTTTRRFPLVHIDTVLPTTCLQESKPPQENNANETAVQA
jgi:hypothetical protein